MKPIYENGCIIMYIHYCVSQVIPIFLWCCIVITKKIKLKDALDLYKKHTQSAGFMSNEILGAIKTLFSCVKIV